MTAATSKSEKKTDKAAEAPPIDGIREAVESIAMAIILAMLFRTFVAEPFVIPTGSMAPTLRGRHKDLQCVECGTWFQAGASQEVDQETYKQVRYLLGATCPNCRHTQPLDPADRPDDGSVDGDRIIVSKFAYDTHDPKRWDVIVFRYPGDPTINYIKRLVGLPNETLRIQGGNIWIKKPGETEFKIARKPADKLPVLLQKISDSDHQSKRLREADWPLSWFEPPVGNKDGHWKTEPAGQHGVAFTYDGSSEKEVTLRYRHIVPLRDEWNAVMNGDKVPVDEIGSVEGELITDFYAYNDHGAFMSHTPQRATYATVDQTPIQNYGHDWVDDLAVEFLAEVQSSAGKLQFGVIRGGEYCICTIDVATGEAKLERLGNDRQPLPFDASGAGGTVAKAQTSVKGPGRYRLRLSNCDHEMLLWVNDSVVATDVPTTYTSPPLVTPSFTLNDPGDLQPALISSTGVKLRLSQLRMFRDKYYIAQKQPPNGIGEFADCSLRDITDFSEFIRSPKLWANHSYFTARGFVEFPIGADEFFPMGDNSPASQDARTWPEGRNRITPPNAVKRDLLVGKAVFVYWPHTWYTPVYWWPNPGQMRPIR